MSTDQKNRKIIFRNPGVMWHNFEGYSTWNQSLYSEKIDNFEGYRSPYNPEVIGHNPKVTVITLGLRVLDEYYLNNIFIPARITHPSQQIFHPFLPQ